MVPSIESKKNFTKGEENKGLDETTGVDITKNIEAGSGRVPAAGSFLAQYSELFLNTIFTKTIRQIKDRCDKLAAEVTEKLINVTTTLDDNISADKAISERKVRMGKLN